MKRVKEKNFKYGFAFDVIFTLIAVGVIATGLYFALKPEKKISANVEYMVVFDNVKKEFASNLSSDEKLLSEHGDIMGFVDSVLNDNKIFYTVDTTVSGSAAYIPHVSDEFNLVTVTITGEAIYNDGCYYIGGFQLLAGEEIVLRTDKFYGKAKIVSVTVIG